MVSSISEFGISIVANRDVSRTSIKIMAKDVDPDERVVTSRRIWVYTVCKFRHLGL